MSESGKSKVIILDTATDTLLGTTWIAMMHLLEI